MAVHYHFVESCLLNRKPNTLLHKNDWKQIKINATNWGKILATYIIKSMKYIRNSSVQFSSVAQSCLTLGHHGLQHVRPPCPSPTPRVYSNSCPLSRWCLLLINKKGKRNEYKLHRKGSTNGSSMYKNNESHWQSEKHKFKLHCDTIYPPPWHKKQIWPRMWSKGAMDPLLVGI